MTPNAQLTNIIAQFEMCGHKEVWTQTPSDSLSRVCRIIVRKTKLGEPSDLRHGVNHVSGLICKPCPRYAQVTQRTRELGLRMALGASRNAVIWLILKQASWMLVVGAMVGLILSYFLTRSLTGFLYGIKSHDQWTLGGMTVLLLVSGWMAALGPARRAAHVDPMVALRAE